MQKQAISAFQNFNEKSFTKVTMYKHDDSTMFILNFNQGQVMPAHYHPGAELHLHVIQGNGTFTIDGNEFEATSGDVVHCKGTEKMGFTNTGNELVSICVTLSKVSETNIDIEGAESC